ncbi:MAG: DUF4159 domain-containing protein [Micavibrio sp.]
MIALGQIVFMNPWILAGLLALPVLWFLLRVFPPVPRMIHLPSAWLLDGLIPEQQTTSKTPWWILLLRTLIAALILLALAQPVINPAESLNISGSLRIVMDNGWASGQTWQLQSDAARQIVDRAARDQRDIFILTTAPEAGASEPLQQGPMTPAQAQSILRGLKPQAWPADYNSTRAVIEKNREGNGIHSIWIGHGLDDGKGIDLARALQQQGGLTYMEPEAGDRPLLLLPRLRAGQDLSVAVNAAKGFPDNFPVTIEALSNDGRVLDRQSVTLKTGETPLDVSFALPESLRGQVGQFRLYGRGGAGAVLLLDDLFNRRSVGLVSARDDAESAPLIEAGYYITRALEPYADLHQGSVDELLARKDLSVLILPDIGALPVPTLEALEQWVEKGGLLLRFAGPNMSQADNFLTPVPIRKGERAMSGALTWEDPAKLAPFPSTSPLYGLGVPPELEVHQQLLAEPVADLSSRTWAMLEDGTPLITAAPLERGLIVLVHTTATPQWSNLALSGLYVQMLQRTVSLAGLSDTSSIADGTLHPIQILDGTGALVSPGSTAQPVDALNFEKQMPDSTHPPGIYGRTGLRKAFNIGDRIKFITPMPDLPARVERTGFSGTAETNLMPWLLAAAFGLFLIDWIIILILQGIGTGRFRFALRTAAIVLCFNISTAQAQDNVTPEMIKYAAAIHLAYVKSGSPEIDGAAQRGLENLAQVLNQRTSVEPAGVVAINPEIDDLSFFPLIYWPVGRAQQTLSPAALQNVQFYLDHGGAILFDTRDHAMGSVTQNAMNLRGLTSGLDVPPLMKIPDDHVLTRSFYLMDTFPGRYDNANLWVEEQSVSGRDGVSSIIVGANDWASAWAGISPAEGSQEQEMAFRFGVNLMMYALTGNYKADQVHIPYILERLGQ